MTVARQFLLCLWAAAVTVWSGGAAHWVPAPTNVSYRWESPFIVQVSWSWKKPDNLPVECDISFKMSLANSDLKTELPIFQKTKGFQYDPHKEVNLTEVNLTEVYLTEETHSSQWDVSIEALIHCKDCLNCQDTDNCYDCRGWKRSTPETTTIKTTKPYTELVKNFQCTLESKMNCTWIPINQSAKLKISYSTDRGTNTKVCDRPDEKKNECYMTAHKLGDDVFVLVESETGLSTLKAQYVAALPDMDITEKGNNLDLKLTHHAGGCSVGYTVCITECNKFKHCTEIKSNNKDRTLLIPYDRNCRYEFRYNFTTTTYCISVISSETKVKYYGENRSPDVTLTVVAIVIPIILSACVILSCYCFRRHRDIICPVMPDPSTIFKEMMNGNKESKPATGSLYTPVPEPIEPITLVTEKSELRQNP